MQIFTGEGSGNAENAVRAATQGLAQPSLIIFFTSYDTISEAAALLKEKYPAAHSIGTIGTHLLNGKVSGNNLSLAAFFNDVRAETGIIESISTCPVAHIGEFSRKMRAISPGTEDTVCLEFCTNDEGKLVTTLDACISKNGVSLAGGTVFGAPAGQPSVVACNGSIYKNACAYALVRNTTGHIKVFKENIYVKGKDSKYHFATKVDTSKMALIELDRQPAANVYSKELGIPKDKILENVFKNPMGRVIGDDVFISSMKEMGPNGSIYNYKQINSIDCIYFLELGDYKSIENQTRERIKSEMHKVSFVFSIDCVYRYLLYEKENYFNTYAKDMASLGKHLGFVSGGEQFNNQHVNQTMVCAVFE